MAMLMKYRLRELDQELQVNPSYMNTLKLTVMMRMILVDWLIDVSVHFEISSETLH